MNVFDRGNNDHSKKLHQLIEAGNKQQVFDLVTSLDWLKDRQVPSFPYYHHYLNDLRQVQRLFETDLPGDIPQRAALSFAELTVRAVFDGIQDGYQNEELLSLLFLTGHNVDEVIIPLSTMLSRKGKQIKYLRHIGELLLQFSDVDRAQRVFERAANILCEMSFSEMMEESDGSLWGCERMLVASGCDLAAFGVLDQRIIDRLAEISRTPTEDNEFEGVLYQGALSIGRTFAASGPLDTAIEATELALNNAPHYYQRRMEETRQQVYRELAEALIDSERFDQVEKLLKTLESEQINTTKLWRRYLGRLAKASRLEQLQAVVKGLADKHDPHPYAEEILKAECISLRWRDYKTALELSSEEIRKEQAQAEAYDKFAPKLKALQAYYATRFKIYTRQSHFEDARLALDQLLKLQELSEGSGENSYQAVDLWFEEQKARTWSAFQLINLDNEKWSYTPDILPKSYHHSVSDLVHTLLVQGQYDLLERLDNLENPRPWKSTQIQTLLNLKDARILGDLEAVDFSGLYGDEKETRAEAYRYLVFKLTLDGTLSATDQVPDIPGLDSRPLLIAYAQAIALDQGLEIAFELLKPVLDNSSELDRVRFALAIPFLWLRDIEQAEKAIYQCYEWHNIYVDAGRPLLISLLWRLSTKCTASELATKVKDYIQRGRFEFANAIEFARDMLFIDEHYAREFMLVLLKLWLPAPSFSFVGEKLRSIFRDEQNAQLDLPKEVILELETALDTTINPEAFDHLAKLESYLNLDEIADLNILVQMWAYYDAHNDGQAAEHIMRRMIKLAAETDISLPPSVFPQGSWDGVFGA